MTHGSIAAAALVAGLIAVPALAQITINEIRIDQPGTDNDEYFELAGPPATSLTGLTYIVIGDVGADGCGVIEVAVSLAGLSIPADGYFLCVEPTFTLGIGNADLVTAANGLNFENTCNVTHMLVTGFTGASGDDLDPDNDGVLNTTPWTAILDSVAVRAVAVDGDCVYSATQVGPDASQPTNPGHAYRCPNGSGGWLIGAFADLAADTPGAGNAGPTITTQPMSQTACPGAPVTFMVAATGGTLTYQWRKDGTDIGGATADSYSIASVTAGDAGTYDVVVSNGCVALTSDPATLTVGGSTSFTTQPMSQCVFEGASATFSVVVNGAPPITYQWRKDGNDITNATSASYMINPVTAADAGTYDVSVTSGCGSATSDPATLTVKTVPMVTINEIRIDQTGTDNDEYFELCGAPGTPLSGLTYLVIGDGGAGNLSGIIEAAIDLGGTSIPANGHFLAAEDTFTLGVLCGRSADLVIPSAGNVLNFENSDNVTHLLVAGFTGALNDDLDADNDCLLDATPWFSILDQVSLVKGSSPPEDCIYAPTIVGPDDMFVPAQVHRCPDCTGNWFIGSFDTTCRADETPGFGNPPCILTQPASQTVCEGQPVTFTVVAAGADPVTYQWRKNGSSIAGATSASYTIDFVVVGDAGSYAVSVTDANGGIFSDGAQLTVQPLFGVRAGNINGGAGPVMDVVFLNNSAGSNPERRVVIGQGDRFELRIVPPPSRPAGSRYIMYAWRGEPTKQTKETLPAAIGDIAMPTPVTGNAPQPLRRANNVGAAIFGSENWPPHFSPTQPAPFTLLLLPRGTMRTGTFYFQGIEVDSAAPNGRAGVTNGILVVSQ